MIHPLLTGVLTISLMEIPVDSLKTHLARRREQIRALHRTGATGFETCAALTESMDAAIRSGFDTLPGPVQKQLAVLAVGGYGRAELSPESDIDIMIVYHPVGRDPDAAGAAQAFLHILWDAGVDAGHSVRTVDDAVVLHGKAIDSWASMLEARFLCGSEQLAKELTGALHRRAETDPDNWFIRGVIADIGTRHSRYGNSVKLLEPNIKKSAGGLRDLHVLYWLFRSTNPEYFTHMNPHQPASKELLGQLHANGIIGEKEHRDAVAALQFLLRTRHEMHYLRDSLHDTLEYALQLEVAEGLGYGRRDHLSSVEVFMREYYLHARTIHRLNRQVSRRFRETIEPVHRETREGRILGEIFVLYDDTLGIIPDTERFTAPKQLLEPFAYAAENDVDMDFRLHGIIEKNVDLLDDNARRDPENALLFRRILASRNVARTLHLMNELDVLGRYIPEFGDLVAFFQHNVYHYFTADEHTLIAIANAEGLREQQGVLREVFRNLKRKDTLFLAILLHDIAKPRGVVDHEIAGVDMARMILERIGMNDIFPDIAFLVRNHLLMEQIAFRRNIHDAGTIREFAAKFDRPEQLDQLYLLTYADLSAVNINVWTEWKAAMLQELYQRTSEVLRRDLKGDQIDAFHESRRAAAEVGIVERLSAAMPREHVEQHLQGIQSDAYLSLFTEDEIGLHIAQTKSSDPVSVRFSDSGGYTEITIVTRDAPFALSRFCAVLAANDANILDANIFTRDDGMIIDRFRVSDATTTQQLERAVCAKILEDLKRVMEGTLDVEHLFQAHHRKWKRRPRLPVNPRVRTAVEFEDNPRYTIIDVYAPDSVGFLYRVTETISRLGLDIYFAKIATRVDGIVDAFYVRDRSGQPVNDPEQREGIRREILSTVRSISEQQLTDAPREY